jgi:hypothetical protein
VPDEVAPRSITAPVALGRYRLGPVLGRGATAWVYRARDLAGGADVAVKAIPCELGLSARVGAEIRAAARLDHPGVVSLLDWGEDHDALYLVWELIDGEPLGRRLRRGIGDRAAVALVADVLEALAHAHGRGVVHRDVKPSNVLVGRDGRARLSDFGVARIAGESGLTRTGGVVGTMAYMAPEQAEGRSATAAADVYAASLVLYEALAGRNPIASPNPAETARRAAAGVSEPLSRARPDLGALSAVVDAGLARDPARRPTAESLARALRRSAGRRHAPERAGRAALLASAAVGGAAGAAVAWQGLGLPALAVAVAAAASAIATAVAPLAAAAGLLALGVAAVGRVSPGLAILAALAGTLTLVTGRRTPRLLLAPVAAPVLAAIGLAPLYFAALGPLRPWTRRLWAAVVGAVLALAWQIGDGTERLLLTGDPARPALRALEGVNSPVVALRRTLEPVRDRPAVLAVAALLVAAAMAAPLVLRARPGAPRVAAAAAWCLALGIGAALLSGDAGAAAEAMLPSCILVPAWAARPWRRPGSRARRRAVIIRGPAA